MSRLTCPTCNHAMTAQNRPPKLKHSDRYSSLATNYCICRNCGARGKAVITVTLVKEFPQDDLVTQAQG